jgi:multicomponent Na+:H+ antiporter subunit C
MMHVLLAAVVGLLYAAGLYMMLRRSIIKLLIGLVLVGHASNLLIFTSAGLLRGSPPLVPPDQQRLGIQHTDPLPPALILTAIVISFAILAFAAVLVKRAYQEIGSDDLHKMRSTEQ